MDQKAELILKSKQNYWNQRIILPRVVCIILSVLNLYHNTMYLLSKLDDTPMFWRCLVFEITPIM